MLPPLRYTICFCLREDRVLMLRRRNPPYEGLWNGLGGKIETGELPRQSVQREILEESGVDLREAVEVRFGGLVTWLEGGLAEDAAAVPSGGMFAFLAQFDDRVPLGPDRENEEGSLSWRPLRWVCDPGNHELADIVPRYLPRMLEEREPREYRFHERDGTLEVRALPAELAAP
jgi:8-oxo-dGTP diphosphatase